MRVCHHEASCAESISGIDSQEDRLDTSVTEMLVDQMALPKAFHFSIDAVSELGAISGEFQPVISMGANILYPAPDPTIAVGSPFHRQKFPGIPGAPGKIHPAGLHSGYLVRATMPPLREADGVLRSFKSRVGNEVGGLYRPNTMSKAGKAHHQADQS